ncbi:MAG: hypothetical protein WBA23_13450 [Tunicatimonas sp.]
MRNSIVLIFLLALLTQCDGEFIPDPLDPRLPRYSEEGKNAAGCFIDDDIWRAVKVAEEFTLTFPGNGAEQEMRLSINDSTIRVFIDGNLIDNSNSNTNIEFEIDNRQTQFQSTDELHQQTFVLDGARNFGRVRGDHINEFTDCRGAGQLIIRYAQPDPDAENYYIVAGTFFFTTASGSCQLIKVKSGRFDYQVRAIED